MTLQFNNELTPALLATMDQSPFTVEQLAAFCRQHSVNAIYRLALVGSVLSNADVIVSPPQLSGVPVPEDFLAVPGA